MSNPVIKAVIRAKFLTTSRGRASAIIREASDRYLRLADRLDAEAGRRPVRVPPMPGVDPEMREWSFFQILEHNAIVNRSIAAIVEALALGREPSGAALIDPKTDVLPGSVSGPEQVDRFRESVDDYLTIEASLPRLRGTAERPHPLFGSFDAHKWHCMLGLHLETHLSQARRVLSRKA